MAKGMAGRVRVAAAYFTIFGAVLAGTSAHAQISVGLAAESPSDALARNMKILGTSPKSFEALIAAGRAALALGDTQAAAGFFGRADEVWPSSPLPQAGMGAALAQEGDGNGALQFFATAMQRGATQSMIGCGAASLTTSLAGMPTHRRIIVQRCSEAMPMKLAVASRSAWRSRGRRPTRFRRFRRSWRVGMPGRRGLAPSFLH